MILTYLKFAIYLSVAVSSAIYVYGYLSDRLSGAKVDTGKRTSFAWVILLACLSLACFYLAIRHAAVFIFPHLQLTY